MDPARALTAFYFYLCSLDAACLITDDESKTDTIWRMVVIASALATHFRMEVDIAWFSLDGKKFAELRHGLVGLQLLKDVCSDFTDMDYISFSVNQFAAKFTCFSVTSELRLYYLFLFI